MRVSDNIADRIDARRRCMCCIELCKGVITITLRNPSAHQRV
jgi:hypothetical protein